MQRQSFLLLFTLSTFALPAFAQKSAAGTFQMKPLVRGQAEIDYDLAAWATLAAGFAPPPVLFLDEVFDQAEANAADYNGILSIDDDIDPDGDNLIYEMNGAVVVNQTGRTTQPTTFSYGAELTQHTGAVGLGGITRWDVLPGGAAGHLLFGDFTLLYDSSRIALGGSGWCLYGNIAPQAVVFDLLNVFVTSEFGSFSVSGDLGISFEMANFLFVTPADHLVDVGDFTFTAIDRSHPKRVPASAIVRLGSPANPLAFFSEPDMPRIGTTWKPFIDHTAFAPTATLDFVLLGTGGPANVPGVNGTLLCNAPTTIFTAAPGVPVEIPIPFNPALIGVTRCSQGGSFVPGSGTVYANALDLVIGL